MAAWLRPPLLLPLLSIAASASTPPPCVHSWQEFKSHLQSESYNKLLRPGAAVPCSEPPCADSVNVQLQAIHIQSIDAKAKSVEMGGYVRVRWVDQRLRFNASCMPGGVTVPSDEWGVLWLPDWYLDNKITETRGSSAFIISSDGFIW